MNKIIPNLWYDQEAKEAAEFYVSVFGGDSAVSNISTIHGTPSGDCDIVSFRIWGYDFMAISAGPYFKFNPSVSFHVKCKTKAEVDALWEKLVPGGKVLMELGAYPFSERYGWLQDKYGLSWQLIYVGEQTITQAIMPALLFVGNVCGKTEDAINLWTSVFPDSKTNRVMRYPNGAAPDKEGAIQFASFTLFGQEFGAMDSSAHAHKFQFNEAVSFIVRCDDQAEIDRYWKALSAVPESEQCGWLKDQFGVSWQIVPVAMDEMMKTKDRTALDRVTQALLQMKKLDLQKLQAAYEGKS